MTAQDTRRICLPCEKFPLFLYSICELALVFLQTSFLPLVHSPTLSPTNYSTLMLWHRANLGVFFVCCWLSIRASGITLPVDRPNWTHCWCRVWFSVVSLLLLCIYFVSTEHRSSSLKSSTLEKSWAPDFRSGELDQKKTHHHDYRWRQDDKR